MRKLGEQWIEEIEGVRHLLKVIGNEHNATCMGCSFSYWNDPYEAVTCFFEDEVGSCPVCQRGGFAVRDLGPVNEEGCLAEERTGLYPEISDLDGLWRCRVISPYSLISCTASTRQQAIDNWNRRNHEI